MIDYVAYIAVRALNKILGFVPISASLWLGRRIGDVVFFFNKERRLVAYANLKSAFAGEKTPSELRSITKRVYRNMVQTFVELLNLTKVNRKYCDRYVEVVNMDRIRNASKSGRGTILLTAHFGDWELSSLVSSVEGFPILVLVREQKMKRLNELLNTLRESNGCKVIRKGMDVKNILKALYGKNIVGILSDQDAGKNGVFVDFFGRPTSYHSGPFEIAKHTGSLILPNFIVRTGGPYHKLYLEEYIDFGKGPKDGDMKENVQRFAKLLEDYIRKYPDQWLWLHKRWKSTPVRTVLVLNDGKAGHLNQSMAVADQLRRARMTQGYGPEDTKVVVVDVKYKSRFSRVLLTACASLVGWRCHGRMGIMKLCLEKETYDTLMKTYSEFVVSCGSALAPVNVFIAKENCAKNIVVMRPNMPIGLGKFNLAVIPRHDKPRNAKNVVVTDLAPNLIDETKLAKGAESMKDHLHADVKDAVALFVGGDNPEFRLTGDIMNSVIQGVSEFCNRSGASMLTTTSRRTSPEIENILKKRLNNYPRSKLLVVANDRNFDFTVSGMLALSKVAIVSEESISMISEAISAGKKVVVFRLSKNAEAITKHERALKSLEKEGYVAITESSNLMNALEKVWNDKAPVTPPKDMERVFEALRKLI
ncbi:MAG: ELM1/GtrOC1 family putative glycosyltransferase [Candidatus Omnitrophica bacterium]|nr:ELM1/GtrOC1 family putative glycosyltransferase [Candidatus Omnitrophota bacterium]MDD5436088.1 ELM1/GtrOC1 family putative glycosyltransferase [Candidatus Omnitrophota bacterium]